jgi:hypothetical protein
LFAQRYAPARALLHLQSLSQASSDDAHPIWRQPQQLASIGFVGLKFSTAPGEHPPSSLGVGPGEPPDEAEPKPNEPAPEEEPPEELTPEELKPEEVPPDEVPPDEVSPDDAPLDEMPPGEPPGPVAPPVPGPPSTLPPHAAIAMTQMASGRMSLMALLQSIPPNGRCRRNRSDVRGHRVETPSSVPSP